MTDTEALVAVNEIEPLVHHHREVKKIESNLLVFGNLVKSFFGAGLLGISYGARMGGYAVRF